VDIGICPSKPGLKIKARFLKRNKNNEADTSMVTHHREKDFIDD
jgi:hypothetical protein